MLYRSVLLATFFLTFFTTLVNADKFAYYTPGSIMPKTGGRGLSTGKADFVVHAPGILFPILPNNGDAKAFANSQVFNPGGGSYEGTDSAGFCDRRNYHYPWRDIFCELRTNRSRVMPECPSGFGHQGQDIRADLPPPPCSYKTYQHIYVAVAAEDVTVENNDVGDTVVVSLDGERRYDYLHMLQEGTINGKPATLSFSTSGGKVIKRGQHIGFISHYLDGPMGTTPHLHFAIRKKVRDEKGGFLYGGKQVYVNPYMSLVRAYESLIGETGTMLDAPAICQSGSQRCETNFPLPIVDKKKDPDPRKAGTIVCNETGTGETIEWCSGNTCGTSTSCEKGGVSPPPDMSIYLPPKDMSASPPPDLSATCDPRACLCGCNGALCRNQICTPSSAYCTTATTRIECSTDGCTSTTRSCGYGCSGDRCNDPPGTMDMSLPPPPDLASPPPGVEVCNGLDDNGDGIIDNPASCWQWITRFKDPITGARCYGVGSIPPFACTAYDREFTLFAVPTVQWSDGSNSPWVQCSRGIDHVLTKQNSIERSTLEGFGWNCSLNLGYFFEPGYGPRLPKRTPYANTCPLYRQQFPTSGSQSHLFTPFNESVVGAVCQPPVRADVVSITGCGVPPGC